MKPTSTACMAISFEMPKNEQAIGMSSREPPATPDAPQAARVDRKLSAMAVGMETSTPMVRATDRDMMVITAAAPSMLMVAPSGMETE